MAHVFATRTFRREGKDLLVKARNKDSPSDTNEPGTPSVYRNGGIVGIGDSSSDFGIWRIILVVSDGVGIQVGIVELGTGNVLDIARGLLIRLLGVKRLGVVDLNTRVALLLVDLIQVLGHRGVNGDERWEGKEYEGRKRRRGMWTKRWRT